MVDVIVTGKKIREMELVSDINGSEKMPTDVVGDKAVSTGQILHYVNENVTPQWGRIEGDIALQTDLNNLTAGVKQSLENHLSDGNNPHNVTKAQVGLGNVDNTSDVNKPVSTLVQAELDKKVDKSGSVESVAGRTGHIELTPNDIGYPELETMDRRLKEARFIQDASGKNQQEINDYIASEIKQKAPTEYVNEQLELKAPKETTYTKTEVDSALSLKAPQETTYTKTEIDTVLSNLGIEANKFYPTLAEANADIANISVNQPVTVGEAVNGGLWYKTTSGATTLTKSPYDLAQLLKTNATFARSNVTPIAINTTAKTLTIGTGLTISSNLEADFQVAAQTVSIPSSSGSYLLCYDRATKTASLKTSKTTNEYVIGYVYVYGSNITANFDFSFTIDGQSIFTKRTGELHTSGTNINIDISAGKLNITDATVRLIAEDVNELVAGASLNLPSADGAYQLRYNLSSKEMTLSPLNSSQSFIEVNCGVLRKTGGTFTLFGVPHYTINGLKPSLFMQFAKLTASRADLVVFNTTTKKLTITGARLVIDERTFTVTGVADIPAADGVYNISYDVVNSQLAISPTSTSLTKNFAVFGQLLVSSGDYFVFDIPVYQLNTTSSLTLSKNVGVFVASSPANINFNFITKKVEIIIGRLLYGNEARSISSVTVDISANTDVWNQLIFNTSTFTWSRKRTTETLTNAEIRVALFHLQARQVFGVPYYSINGAASGGGDKNTLRNAPFIVPYGDIEADYNQPELPSYQDLALNVNGDDYTKIHDMYDALVAEYPDYIKRTTLGLDGLGNPLHQYQFNMLEPNNASDGFTKPKVILISGIHGYEKAGVYNLYYAMKEICERWKEDSKLEALKWGVNFLVVPVVNPSGFNLNTRKNHNGVDLNRNFSYGWELTSSSLDTYGGAAPLDQAETVIVDALMSNNRDAVYFGSCHNFFTSAGAFVWNSAGSIFGVNLAKSLLIKQTIKTKARYEWMPQSNDYYIGYTSLGDLKATERTQANEVHGINGSTFEICERLHWESGTPRFSSAVATIGVETLINWILLNVKYGCDLHNSRVNL